MIRKTVTPSVWTIEAFASAKALSSGDGVSFLLFTLLAILLLNLVIEIEARLFVSLFTSGFLLVLVIDTLLLAVVPLFFLLCEDILIRFKAASFTSLLSSGSIGLGGTSTDPNSSLFFCGVCDFFPEYTYHTTSLSARYFWIMGAA